MESGSLLEEVDKVNILIIRREQSFEVDIISQINCFDEMTLDRLLVSQLTHTVIYLDLFN